MTSQPAKGDRLAIWLVYEPNNVRGKVRLIIRLTDADLVGAVAARALLIDGQTRHPDGEPLNLGDGG